MTIKKGTIVYHGTSARGFETLEGPAWVTTSISVADVFVWRYTGPSPRVLMFQTTKPVKLMLIESQRDLFDAIIETGADPVSEMSEIAEAFADHFGTTYDGWIIPDNYPDGDDILLVDPGSVLEPIGVLKRKR
jgi:hypothetical protein